MTIEKTLKSISATLAIIIIYVFLGGIYLSAKGFVSDGKGGFILGKIENPIINDALADELNPNNNENTTSQVLKDKILGDENAPVTIYEISSYTCPHCATFNQSTLPFIKEKYIETKKANFIHIDFPFDGKSMGASMITNCEEDIKKYYKFVSLIFKNQKQWSHSYNSKEIFINYAKQSGIPEKEAYKCLENRDLIQKIANRKAYFAKTYGINSTPSFIIKKGDKYETIRGAQPYQVFVAAIEKVSQNK
jgi:protein-disulfide isomerase